MQNSTISSIDLDNVIGGAPSFTGWVKCNDNSWSYLDFNPARNGIQGACSSHGGAAPESPRTRQGFYY